MKKKLPNPNEGLYSVIGAQFAAPALPVIKEIRNKDKKKQQQEDRVEDPSNEFNLFAN